jgi:hypothetical protein
MVNRLSSYIVRLNFGKYQHLIQRKMERLGSDDEGAVSSTPAVVNLEGVGVNNTLSVTGGNLARPIGTKAAKQQLKDDRSTAILEAVRTQEISSLASSVSSLAASHKMVAASIFRKVDLKVIIELR